MYIIHPTVYYSPHMITPSKKRTVIGIDPGLAATGYGIITSLNNRMTYIAHGVINTSSKDSHQSRLVFIYTEINKILDLYLPTEGGMETLYFAKNVTSALGVAEARGVLSLALAIRGIVLGEYSPKEIKQAVTGSGGADKKLVQESVRLLLGMKEIPKPDHAADALAAAITRIHTLLLN